MFGKALRLPFRLAGIPLDVDISFLLVLPLMAWIIGSRAGLWAQMWGIPDARELEQGATPYVLGLIAAVGLFICVVLHELGHSVVARKFGVKVRSITLWFLGGVAKFEEIPRKAGAEALVGIAGPLVSIVLGGIFWGLLFVTPREPGLIFVLAYLAVMNLMLAAFNLIPAMPLDGGRVLRSVLALFMSYGAATQVAGIISQVLSVALGIFALFTGQWFLLLIAVFVYMAGRAETRATDTAELLRGAHVGDIMSAPALSVPPDLSVEELSTRVLQEHHRAFPVVDDQEHVVGVVSVRNMAHQPPTVQVAQIMSTPVPTVAPSEDAAAAYRQMNDKGLEMLVVTDGARRPLGVLTRMDLLRLMQLRSMAAGIFRRREMRPV